MRDEKVNGEVFRSVLEANAFCCGLPFSMNTCPTPCRVVLAEWVDEYNTRRPHRGLQMKTPQQFYESVREGSR